MTLGWLVNLFYAWAGLDISRWVTSSEAHGVSPWSALAGVTLLVLILQAFWRSRQSAGCCGE